MDGKSQIWVIDPKALTVSPREVTVLSRDDDSVLISQGVQPGERIVSAGVNSLKPGQKVKIDEDHAQ